MFHSKGHKLILCVDFNETIGDRTNGIDYLVAKYSLTDVIQDQYGPHNQSTYARGNKCLDYIFVSQNVLSSIQQSAVLLLNYVISVYIDLHTNLLFGRPISPLMSSPSRTLRSSNKKQSSQYIDELHKLMEQHHVFERTRELI